MSSAVTDLKLLVSPPKDSHADFDWAPVEDLLGCPLPTDYRQLVETYGQGSFDGFLWVLQPSAENLHLDLLRQREVRLDALRALQKDGEAVPYEVGEGHAELLPWAITDNGDVCYWNLSSSADPDRWPIAINEGRGATWMTFDLTASGFLVAVFSRRIRVDIFPDDFPSDLPVFEAIRY